MRVLSSCSTNHEVYPNRTPSPCVLIRSTLPDATPFSTTVSMDFITELPNLMVLTPSPFRLIMMSLSRRLCSLHSTITADSTATLYRNHVWKPLVFPVNLSQIAALSSPPLHPRPLFPFEYRSSPFHGLSPAIDGQTERVNQELEQYLRAYTSIRQTIGFPPLYHEFATTSVPTPRLLNPCFTPSWLSTHGPFP